ncbi:MAG: isoprenylcysteine carboxylmethyltransferase family protein [Gammaproteobacteria bacterium]
MPPVFVTIRATIYATAFVGLWAWLAVTVQPFDAWLGVGIPRWVVAAGVTTGAFGAALIVACISAFVQAGRGTPAPFDPPREFVTSGPYHVVRNPMYVGGFAVIVGAGLALRSISIVGLGLAFLLLAHLFVVYYEEPQLERRFGANYLEYKGRVGRWFPKRDTDAGNARTEADRRP